MEDGVITDIVDFIHVQSTVAEAAAGEHVWYWSDSQMRSILNLDDMWQKYIFLQLQQCVWASGINCFGWIFTFILFAALCFDLKFFFLSPHSSIMMNLCLCLVVGPWQLWWFSRGAILLAYPFVQQL